MRCLSLSYDKFEEIFRINMHKLSNELVSNNNYL